MDPTARVGATRRLKSGMPWLMTRCLVIDTRNDYEVATGSSRGCQSSNRVVISGGEKKPDPKSTARSQCFAQAEFAAKSRRLFLCLKGLTRSARRRHTQISRESRRSAHWQGECFFLTRGLRWITNSERAATTRTVATPLPRKIKNQSTIEKASPVRVVMSS